MKRSLIKDLTKPAEGAFPVYFIAGLAGHVLHYRPLARLLAERWLLRGILYPVYAGGSPRTASLEDLADQMRAALDDPQDPVVLAGYSVGGTIAYEIAVALRRQGRRAGVVMIDSQPRSLRRQLRKRRLPMVRRAIRLGRKVVQGWQGLMGRQAHRDPDAPPEVKWTPEDPQVRIFQIESREAVRAYVPPGSDVPVVILKAVTPRVPLWLARIYWPGADNGWRFVAPVAAVLPVSATHHTIMEGETQLALASALAEGCGIIHDALARETRSGP